MSSESKKDGNTLQFNVDINYILHNLTANSIICS